MYLYNVYGLTIESALPLPELLSPGENHSPIDVSIYFENVLPSLPNIAGRNHHATPDRIDLHYEGVGRLSVRNGRNIVVDPLPDVDEGLLRTCLLGPAFAALLHQKGKVVLHASAVMIDGAVVAFLGNKGFGKSTMAASLLLRNHPLLADDIVALDVKNGIKMSPSFPQVKLWPSAAVYFGLNLETMPKLQPNLEKRIHNFHRALPMTSVGVEHIYILDIGEKVEIVPARPKQAFIELTRNLYVHRFLEATGTLRILFQQCSQIVREIPISYLKRPASLAHLAQTAALLEQNTGAQRRRTPAVGAAAD